MKQTNSILPVFTSDVSGVCAALYEMGGLCVMHDPSGCNSTYNTHDEIRWYEKDSLIFISGLTERDAVMGNDEKFYSDVLYAADMFKPGFIAITNSPIPYIIGTDFAALVKRLKLNTGIPVFYVPANGMHDYTVGAGKAFAGVAERLVDGKYSSVTPHSVNVLGMTPLDYAAKGSTSGIRDILEGAGYKVNSVWAMDDDPGHIARSGEASVNLVVSSTGLYAAKKLEKRFGTPYVAGTPVGAFTDLLIREMGYAEKTGKGSTAYLSAMEHAKLPVPHTGKGGKIPETCRGGADTVYLIGEPVVMGSLAAALRLGKGLRTRVICPTEIYGGLLGGGDIRVHGEEEIKEALSGAGIIIGDPMYEWVAPETAKLYPLPTVALSGRIHLNGMVGIAGLKV